MCEPTGKKGPWQWEGPITKRHIGSKWIHVTKQMHTIYTTYLCIAVLLYTLVIIPHSRVPLSMLYPSFHPTCSIHPIATTTLYPQGWILTYVYIGTAFVTIHFSYPESVELSQLAHCIHCITIINGNNLSSFLFNKVELLFAESRNENQKLFESHCWCFLMLFDSTDVATITKNTSWH